MIGFKSFVEKLDIRVPAGLSAIVGPNGCGKSNIVDAVRWAMGEQSAKLLRGRQMEDVIFSGAGESKPLGMAEVSILFENGNGSIPGPFSHDAEISITRRLYRSGESEYLINNVPCRLKDIAEIFMDTGLGNRAYSIIGQGKISAIVEQKPEETRMMLEEAAGITRYRKKVGESRRKVELTKANLQRVEDILIELKRQMRSLKRQAGKARRFKALSEEIKRLELVLNANSYSELKGESRNRRASTEELMQEEVARSTAFSRNQAMIETLNLELEEKNNEIFSLRETYSRLKERVSSKESRLESSAAEKRMQEELAARLRDEKEDLKRRLGELQEEKTILIGKIDGAKKASADLEDEIALFNKRLRSRQELLKQVKEQFEEARTKVSSEKSKEMSLSQESGYLAKRLDDISDGRARLESEREEVASKIHQITGASQRKRDVREALSRKVRDIEEEVDRERQACDELEETKSEFENRSKSIEASLNLSHSRLTSLQSLTENYEGYKLGVRTIMKAKDLEARKQGRIMGLVADLIQVESKYEAAVEAVLADKLQYIIVERQEDGKEAVDYLKVRAKGRSSFVPFRDFNGNAATGKQNGYPLLRNLVSVPDDYRTLMNVLLGDAALVSDLDQAMEARAKNGKNQCLVTPEGDMVDESGVISGGKLAHRSQGILARKREIKKLKKEVKKLESELKDHQKKIENSERAISARRASLEGLVDEKSDCQEEINELDNAIFRLSHELDQLEKLSSRITQELENKDKEENKQKEVLEKIESELEVCKKGREQEEEYLLKKERELRESEEEFEQFREEQARLKLDYSLTREEERGLKREVERIDDFVHEAQRTIGRIEEDVLKTQVRCRECDTRAESLRQRLEGLYVELERSEKIAAKAEQGRDEFHAGIKEEEKKAEESRKEVEDLKEKLHSAQIEQSEIGFKMDNIVELVKEKYNLDLPAIYGEYLEEDFSASETREELERKKALKEKMGEVNLTAIQEHDAIKERFTFISDQREDLINSIESLNSAIRKINRTSLERFKKTFAEVDGKLKEVFPILFNGGTAGLRLVDETKPLDSGVLVEVKPPGKKLSHMGLLSGGEKALVAMAFLFAIYLIKPSPFCLLDEVDAPLDEANIDRFNNLLKEIKKYSQVILVTHNRRTMEIVDRLYGVTMEQRGISKLVSVDFQGLRQMN